MSLNINEPTILASRGRLDNGQWVQKLEIGNNISNALTTVQKNNYVIIPEENTMDAQINVVGNYYPSNHDASRIVDCNGIAPTVKENHGTITAVVEPQCLTQRRNDYGKAIRKDYEAGRIDEKRHNMVNLEPRTDGVSNTLTTVQKDNYLLINNGEKMEDKPKIRIRKLTPKECWRLMDFDDEDYEKASKVNSEAQLYKQAGNSIVVNCITAIIGQMIQGKEEVYKDHA